MSPEAHEALVAAVADAIAASRRFHEDAGLTPPTDEALARVAVRVFGGAR